MARYSTAKQRRGKAKHSIAREKQSTDKICKGFALFRNDTKRHGNDMLATNSEGNAEQSMA